MLLEVIGVIGIIIVNSVLVVRMFLWISHHYRGWTHWRLQIVLLVAAFFVLYTDSFLPFESAIGGLEGVLIVAGGLASGIKGESNIHSSSLRSLGYIGDALDKVPSEMI